MTQKRICLIDLSSVFRMAWHASEHEEVGHAVARTVSAVVSCAAGYDAVGVCVDRPPYKRSELAPEYKAQREKAPASMYEQLRHVEKQISEDYGHHILGAQGYEADDVIGKVARWADAQGHEVTIHSADKDLMQLVSGTVQIISTATKQKYGIEEVRAKMGVGPENIADMLALTGDSSDNIAGIKGVGNKTAAGWLLEFGSLQGIIDNADKLTPERFRPVVAQCKDTLLATLKLTSLMLDVPIDPEIIFTKKEKVARVENKKIEVTDEENEATEATPPQATPSVAVSQPAAVVSPPNETALAMTEPKGQAVTAEPWERRLEPRTAGQGWQLANVLFESRMFGQFANAQAVLGIMMTGRALGLDTVASLRNFDMIEGKPSPKAALLIGLVKKHTACEWLKFVEGDEKSATWETKRRDEPGTTKITYTYEQAVKAGHALGREGQVKKNWKDPATMLRWRAGLALCRLVYPDVTQGLYAVEEFDAE